jgi:glutathione synthase/RimK-type ligase-like ATP-grasp enzyme
MKKCALLSMDSLDDFVCYDQLLFDPLEKLGWSVEEVSWRAKNTDWNQFDVVIIRSTWDYQDDPALFLEVLEDIEKSSAQLENSLESVKWNIDKTYLQELENKGIEIVPTLWRNQFHEKEINSYFDKFDTDEIIIKPTVSANADNTFRIPISEKSQYLNQLSKVFKDRSFLVQPFMDGIIQEGEFSLFFFGKTYSHTVLKKPKPSDFRVQEEHGGRLKFVKNPGEGLLNSAQKLLEKIDPLPLYSRMDYVRTDNHSFALMEIELIEPSLYFNMDPASPKRFASVLDEWVTA